MAGFKRWMALLWLSVLLMRGLSDYFRLPFYLASGMV
jgi:hypothetical protein